MPVPRKQVVNDPASPTVAAHHGVGLRRERATRGFAKTQWRKDRDGVAFLEDADNRNVCGLRLHVWPNLS